MYELIGYCGISCENCEIRRAANDSEFAKKLIKGWNKSNPEINDPLLKCQGCKGSDDVCWGYDCNIRICASEKCVDHCGQCSDFKCVQIKEFKTDKYRHHSEAIKKLEEFVD